MNYSNNIINLTPVCSRNTELNYGWKKRINFEV